MMTQSLEILQDMSGFVVRYETIHIDDPKNFRYYGIDGIETHDPKPIGFNDLIVMLLRQIELRDNLLKNNNLYPRKIVPPTKEDEEECFVRGALASHNIRGKNDIYYLASVLEAIGGEDEN
jgi:hypothetical protein